MLMKYKLEKLKTVYHQTCFRHWQFPFLYSIDATSIQMEPPLSFSWMFSRARDIWEPRIMNMYRSCIINYDMTSGLPLSQALDMSLFIKMTASPDNYSHEGTGPRSSSVRPQIIMMGCEGVLYPLHKCVPLDFLFLNNAGNIRSTRLESLSEYTDTWPECSFRIQPPNDAQYAGF